MTTPIIAPYAFFSDQYGAPLNDGYIYIGVENQNPQTNPIPVYWDEDLTIPAAQPLRTSGGYFYRNGSPANVFIDGPCSIVVRNRNGVLAYSEQSLQLGPDPAGDSQWVESGLVPTYISPTQFSVPGDETATFGVGRRVKLEVTAGTVYGTITASVFGAVTTVTVLTDSGAIDSGLSEVSYGIISASNSSLPGVIVTAGAYSFEYTVTVRSTNPDAAVGPELVLYRDSGSPAVNDLVGQLRYDGEDNLGNRREYASVRTQIQTTTPTMEDATLLFSTKRAGASADRFVIGSGAYMAGSTDPGAGGFNAANIYRNGYTIGKLLQQVSTSYASYTGAATNIPLDNSIPQIGEGTEIMTAAITPKVATSTLRVQVTLYMGSDTLGAALIGALFVDATANGLRAVSARSSSTDATTTMTMEYSVVSGSLIARTFRVRVGSSSGNWYTNGNPSSRLFGGVAACTMTVSEIDT